MLKWLRARLLREQKKLFYQNGMAAEGSLYGYFGDQPRTIQWLESIAAENREIALSVDDDELVSAANRDRLLQINRELRRLYDTTASRYLESFDTAHTPLLGWTEYLNSPRF